MAKPKELLLRASFVAAIRKGCVLCEAEGGACALTSPPRPVCPHLKVWHIHSRYLMIVTLPIRPASWGLCLHSSRNEVLLGALINHCRAPAVQEGLDRLQQPRLQIVSE